MLRLLGVIILLLITSGDADTIDGEQKPHEFRFKNTKRSLVSLIISNASSWRRKKNGKQL